MANTTITCPRCQKKLGVPTSKLGRWITCPVCNMEFAALAEGQPKSEPEPGQPASSVPEAELEQDFEPEAPVQPNSLGLILTLSLMTCAIIFCLLALVLTRYARDRQAEQAQAPAVVAPAPKESVQPHETPAPVPKESPTVPEANPPVPAPGSNSMPPMAKPQPGQPTGVEDLKGVAPELTQPLEVLRNARASFDRIVFWWIVFTILHLVTASIIIVWVARDSRNRGMDSPWYSYGIVVFGLIGFFIYIAARRKGDLIVCRHCQNRCLSTARACPHCGNSPKRKKKARRYD